MSAHRYHLGIDGGGTRCRARLREASGALVGEAEGGLANIYQDFNGALTTILATARGVAGQIPLRLIHAGLGLAGATGPEQCARVEAAGLPFASVTVDSDGCAACLGAHRGEDGGIVIAGTGSAGFALVKGRRISVGGHGFALGDQGSGAVIGRALVQHALLAHDGLAPASAMTREILERFDASPARMIEWSRTALSRDYAAFAPLAFAAAGAGNLAAKAIVTKAAAGLAAIARQLQRAGAKRLSLVGGMGPAIAPYLLPGIAKAFQPPLADPLEGAIILAKAGISEDSPSPHPVPYYSNE